MLYLCEYISGKHNITEDWETMIVLWSLWAKTWLTGSCLGASAGTKRCRMDTEAGWAAV